jgi:hypothetical protein
MGLKPTLMVKSCITISLVMLLLAGSCRKTESESSDPSKTTLEGEKVVVAYTFLLEKLQDDSVNLVASDDDEDLALIRDIIRTKGLKLEVENYSNTEKGPDLCHYSKSTRKLVAIIDVTMRTESSYYVSYYIGPEGGASKDIQIEERNGKWTVVNDDGMWNVK